MSDRRLLLEYAFAVADALRAGRDDLDGEHFAALLGWTGGFVAELEAERITGEWQEWKQAA